MDSIREERKKQTNLPRPRVIEVRTTFNKKSKIVKKELSYGSFLFSLERDNFNEESLLLKRFLKSFTPKERANIILSYLETTKYNAYPTVMKIFKRAIERYKEFGNKSDLETYLKNIQGNDGGEPMYRNLTLVRESVIMDLLKDDVDAAEHAVQEMIYGLSYSTEQSDLANTDFEEVYNKNMKSFLIYAAPFKWEDAKGLKILFGE
jgi:hypothetical protein